MVLHTMRLDEKHNAEELLLHKDIACYTQSISVCNVNIFFGKSECIAIVKSFGKTSLSSFSHEEDFMLGMMLGYDRMQQCTRYLKRKKLLAELEPDLLECELKMFN